MNKNASKEEALKKVLNLIQVSPDHAMAFGDDINDIGMLNMCGYSVAMGNAIKELKSTARMITVTNDQDGVAAVLTLLLDELKEKTAESYQQPL
jgi:hydroxymethylpyrimidine pyrophosphatase-like HAD family hydrolase